jgi:HlyD family secretion protein
MKSLLFLATITLSAFVAGCGGGEEKIGGSGFIEATSVVVSSEASGRLEALNVDEGDLIEAGAVIGVVDSSTIKLQLEKAFAIHRAAVTSADIAKINIEQAEQDAVLARKEFDRIAALLDKGSANQQQYDQAENRFEQSKLAMRLARATHEAREAELVRIDSEIALLNRQLANCYPTAPVSGIVIDKLVEAGELLAPGKPIVEIAKTDTVWVKAYLRAGDLTAIRIGGMATVDPEDGRDGPLTGRIVWISEEAEFTPKNVQTAQARADLVYAVKVNVSNPDGVLKIGMPVMVRFSR